MSCQYAKLGGKRELDQWIRHLVLNWLMPQGVPSYLIGRPQADRVERAMRFAPVPNAAAHLRVLLAIYCLGQSTALPFYPKASRAYVEKLASGHDAASMAAAEHAYAGNLFPGELGDAYVQQVFGKRSLVEIGQLPHVVALGERGSFTHLAEAVFAPLISHREHP